MKVIEKKFVSVGGGIGSFCFVDALKIHGVLSDEIAVVSKSTHPYSQFKTYSDASGLYHNERIRSDSGSRIDNFWGFPGYAISELVEELKSLHLTKVVNIFANILAEPVAYDFYSPTAGQVYKSINQEKERIGWDKMIKLGVAIDLQRVRDGRFMITYKSYGTNQLQTVIGNYIHLSLGHNSKFSNKNSRHFWIYDDSFPFLPLIESKGGKVLVIGRGIAAAKVVERLIQARLAGSNLEIISVFKSKLGEHKDHRKLRRSKSADWRLQYFNWPRGSFGGHLKDKVDDSWSEASTPPRDSWLELLKVASEKNFYKILYSPGEFSNAVFHQADYVIDCTGFSDYVVNNSFYKNIIEKYDLPTNKTGGFEISDFFEIEQPSSTVGKVFVSGPAANGNSYGPVDSFMGQQYAATKIIERISKIPGSNMKRLGVLRSFTQWSKWATNTKI